MTKIRQWVVGACGMATGGILFLLLMGAAAAPSSGVAQSGDIRSAIQAHIDNRDPPLDALTRTELAEVKALYVSGKEASLWIGEGRPDVNARAALKLIADAGEEGLDPADYYRDELDRMAARLSAAVGTAPPCDVAAFDVALTAATLRYLRHLHMGRVDPRTLGFRLTVPADDHDFAALLRGALAGHRIASAAADLRPRLAQYGALRAALATYRSRAASDRSRAASESFESIPPQKKSVKPGGRFAGLDVLDVLYRRLVTLGDLPPGTPLPSTYDGALVDAVKRFQARHSLEADGVLGTATVSALNVPLPWRVRQIELALERLRWLPHLGDRPLVAINIPMFRLLAWDAGDESGAGPPTMAVIVGRALRTQTPVFVEEMREVIFRPYWNVPRSILLHEVLPKIAGDPGYLDREDMEIVRGESDNARAVAATPENLALLRQGALRVRQRPGPRNSLGLIKFDFPNAENVYLHGTPAQALFRRSRRDFSHGCVRVEDPVALAEWVLRDRPEWTRERIVSAMNGETSIRVPLPRPVQVILYYSTAVVMPEDGTIHFADDIYRHDAALDRALKALTRRLPGADATGVDVHEIGDGVVADAAAVDGERRAAQLRERNVR